MIKKFSLYQLSYDVSDKEKYVAEEALRLFKKTFNAARALDTEINKILTPFKENPQMSPQEIMDTRFFLRQYRDDITDRHRNGKYDELEKLAFDCIEKMKMFLFDSNTSKLIKSFNTDIDVLEDLIQEFKHLFDNLKDSKFVENIIKVCESIKNKIEEICDLIDNRIKKHIKENILSYSFSDKFNKSKELSDEHTPLLIQIEKSQQGK